MSITSRTSNTVGLALDSAASGVVKHPRARLRTVSRNDLKLDWAVGAETADPGTAAVHLPGHAEGVLPRRSASSGPGTWNDDLEEVADTWLFADPLIRHEFRARPEDLRMITVDGDSMESVLSSGDRILIDVSLKVPVPPGIFVIWDGMGLVAKRIEHLPHSEPPRVVLKSLNPDYDSYERLAEEIRVVGRAVWVSRRL